MFLCLALHCTLCLELGLAHMVRVKQIFVESVNFLECNYVMMNGPSSAK